MFNNIELSGSNKCSQIVFTPTQKLELVLSTSLITRLDNFERITAVAF